MAQNALTVHFETMREPPTVSVIIPAYNSATFLGQTLESALGQSHRSIEVIVVDDGSTDGTATIVAKEAAKDSRLIYLKQPNMGQAAARNAGLRHSRGSFVAFLDSDDLWHTNKLELQLQAAESHSADIIFTSASIFSDDPRLKTTLHLFNRFIGSFTGQAMFDALFEVNNDICMSSALVRKEWMDLVGCFDINPHLLGCEDFEMWLRLARAGARFYGIKERLTCYRIHAMQTSGNRLKMTSAALEVAMKHKLNHSSREVAKNQLIGLHREMVRLSIDAHRPALARRYLQALARRDVGGWRWNVLSLRNHIRILALELSEKSR
jgi:glycosyltransferase involved in cell wall biosynthesis